jgi:hypothetical protein
VASTCLAGCPTRTPSSSRPPRQSQRASPERASAGCPTGTAPGRRPRRDWPCPTQTAPVCGLRPIHVLTRSTDPCARRAHAPHSRRGRRHFSRDRRCCSDASSTPSRRASSRHGPLTHVLCSADSRVRSSRLRHGLQSASLTTYMIQLYANGGFSVAASVVRRSSQSAPTV